LRDELKEINNVLNKALEKAKIKKPEISLADNESIHYHILKLYAILNT
jgi:hypothetical protein